jgi:hypothetical protein
LKAERAAAGAPAGNGCKALLMRGTVEAAE